MKKIIITYLNDAISIEDMDKLKLWLHKPKNQEKFKEFVRVNHELNSLNGHVDTEKAYENVLKRIQNNNNRSGSAGFRNLLKYAAILIGVSIIGYGIYQRKTDAESIPNAPQIVLQLEDGTIQIVNEGQNTIINNASGHKVTEQKEHELVYSQDTIETVLRYNTLKVPYGKTFGITLSDGSKVMLNAGSELRYPVQFVENEKNRTVFLNGEAFFEVAENKKHPFIVNTKDMDVEVLGTRFNVTSYLEDYKTYTVLVEGQVAAHNKLASQDFKILNSNEKVFFENDQMETKIVNVQKYVAWVQGQLVFVEDSFKVIENKLERKYNVTIRNNYSALDEINITATFKNETIDQVLKTFQTYKSFDYTIKDGVVTITKPK